MSTYSVRIAASLLIVLTLIPMIGCTGGIHRKGDQQISVVGVYGHPIKGDAIWPGGDGEAENGGVTASYHYYFADRFAFATNLTPYRNYSQTNGDIPTGEFSLGVRYMFAEFDIFSRPIGLFAEANGGLMYAAKSVPPGGANTNFTQETGLGFEYRITDAISCVGGYHLRHVSDGYLFATENPSQNDHSVFMGIAFSFR